MPTTIDKVAYIIIPIRTLTDDTARPVGGLCAGPSDSFGCGEANTSWMVIYHISQSGMCLPVSWYTHLINPFLGHFKASLLVKQSYSYGSVPTLTDSFWLRVVKTDYFGGILSLSSDESFGCDSMPMGGPMPAGSMPMGGMPNVPSCMW